MITSNVLRCLSPNIDYFVSLMGSLEPFHLYHHFVILDDVSHVDKFGVPLHGLASPIISNYPPLLGLFDGLISEVCSNEKRTVNNSFPNVRTSQFTRGFWTEGGHAVPQQGGMNTLLQH